MSTGHNYEESSPYLKPIVTYFVQNVKILNNPFVIIAEKLLFSECWKTRIFLYWEEKDMVVHMFIVTNVFGKNLKKKINWRKKEQHH